MSELFVFDIEIFDKDKEVKYSFKNCDRELIEKLTDEENILKIREQQFYNYTTYDKIKLLGETFMIMKSTKKNIIMIKLA